MKSLERRFRKFQKRNQYFGDVLSFTLTVENQNFSKVIINRWFNKLIDKADYESKYKKSILKEIYKLNQSNN